LSSRALKAEFDRHGQMLPLLLRYTQSLITQMAQTAVCNRHHSVDEQLCRWLQLSLDGLGMRLKMTQVHANMLGVRREVLLRPPAERRNSDHSRRARADQRARQVKPETLSCECYAAGRETSADRTRQRSSATRSLQQTP
jgi:hypothetical protein